MWGKLSLIAHYRLLNQSILYSQFEKPAELVNHMGAMQAQDYSMVKWAVGCRLGNITEKNVTDALNRGELIRTHLMRPTWHIVSSNDIYWMLDLTAPNIRSGMKGRHKDLELDKEFLQKTNRLITNALEGNNHQTRDELAELMKAEKITLDNNRFAHILMNAEMDQLICSGIERGKKQTYALLSERVPQKVTLTTEESLYQLALRYFNSHGPATLSDFQWWSGLKMPQAKDALALVKAELNSIIYDNEEYWLKHVPDSNNRNKNFVKLLPAYDEYLISYKNRSAVLNPEFNSKALSNNGIFWPVIVVNGMAAGTWKRTIKKNAVEITFDLFQKPGKDLVNDLQLAALDFGKFIGKDVKFV